MVAAATDFSRDRNTELSHILSISLQLGYKLGEFILFRAAEYFHMKMILVDEAAVRNSGKSFPYFCSQCGASSTGR